MSSSKPATYSQGDASKNYGKWKNGYSLLKYQQTVKTTQLNATFNVNLNCNEYLYFYAVQSWSGVSSSKFRVDVKDLYIDIK